MKTGVAGIALIKQFESFESSVYLDICGNASIGWGHRIKRDEIFGDISRSQADCILEKDLEWVESLIADHVTSEINQNQFDALASIIYNVGSGAKNIKDGIITLANGNSSHLLSAINSGYFDIAANEFLKWDHAGGKVIEGLLRRRRAEMNLFISAAQ